MEVFVNVLYKESCCSVPEGFRERTKNPGIGGQVMGAAGGRAPAQGDGRVRHALRVELDSGGDNGRRATAVLAAVHGAETEQGVDGGGGERWGADGRV